MNTKIDFATVLASSVHDMKNSVGMLIASLEQVIEETPPVDDLQAKRFRTLHYEASRINGELVQLLTIYRMQNDFLPVRIDEHYVIDMLDDQIARNHLLIETGNIALNIRCPDSLSWFYDEDLVGNVVHNVLVNCTRYTKAGILVSADLEDDMLCISIADDGPGYPVDMLNRPAGMIEEAEVNKGGTHLGLYFAQTTAELHKQHNRMGYIKLENNGPLGGGVFKLYIP